MNTLILYFLLITLGVILPRNRIVFFMQWIFLTIMIGFNSGGGDLEDYKIIYQSNGENFYLSLRPEFLYQLLNHIFFINGFSLQDYMIFSSFILMSILAYVTLKNTKQPAVVMSLIMIYPGIDMAIQIRNFQGWVFFMLGVHYLINSHRFKRLKYTFCIFLALGFHSIFILYILFIPLIILERKFQNKFKYLYYLFVVALPFILPSLFSIFMSGEKYKLYLENSSFYFSPEKVIFFIIMQVFLLYIVSKLMSKQKKNNIVTIFTYISLLAMPMYFFGSTFIRVYRNIVPIFYIVIFNITYGFVNMSKLTFNIYYLLLVFSAFIHFIVFYMLGAGWQKIGMPIFEQNIIFNLIN